MHKIIRKIKNSKKYNVLFFIIPALIPLIVFWIGPMIYSFLISFTDWDYMSVEYNIVGLANYKELFTDEQFFSALKNTVIFCLGTVIPTIIGGLGLSMLLKKKLKGSAIYKAIIFSPWITPTVAISIVWSWIFDPTNGIANWILSLLGLPQLEWLHSSETALLSVIIVTVWKSIGWAMIFYLSALEKVPEELYEAASIDGANKVQQFFNITVPTISPTTFFLTITTTINSLQAYDQIQILTQGGPSGSTRTMLYMYFQTAFENFNIGKATAIATVLIILTMILSIIQFIVSKRWVHY